MRILLLILTLSALIATGCYKEEFSPSESLGGIFYRKATNFYIQLNLEPEVRPKYLNGNSPDEVITEILEYPPIARQNGTEGEVILYYGIFPDGKVGDIHLIEDPGDDLGQAVMEAVEELHDGICYDPGLYILQINDPIYRQLTVNFAL